MRTPIRWLGFSTIVLTLAGAPALAEPGKGGPSTAHGPKATTTTSPSPKTTGGKPSTTTTGTGKSHSPKTTSNTPTGTTPPTTSGGTTTPTGTTWKPTNAISAKVSTKPGIMTRVNTVLPTGTDLNNATLGFKNFGQFVAAINVSNNLKIPFADLKAAMTGIDIKGLPVTTPGTTGATGTTGTTAPTTMTLGQAIHKLDPTLESESEAHKAFSEANQQIAASTTSTTATKKAKS